MKRLLIIIVSLVPIIYSCESWLDVKPENSVNAEKALSTISGNKSTLMSAYSQLLGSNSYGRQMIAGVEVMADNAKIATSHGNVITDEARNTIGAHANNWTISYRVIRNANFVIDAIDKVEDITAADTYNKRLIKGEAYFLRGWQLFDLARVYSREPNHLIPNFDLGVIIQTKPFIFDGTNIPEIEKPRSTVDETYEQIINDLEESFNLLQDNDNGNFPNRGTALASKAMLARVYLYKEDYASAITAATWVIDNASKYGISIVTGDYTTVFSQSKETIFQLVYRETDNLGSSSMQSIYTNTGLLEPLANNPEWYRDEKKGSGYGDVLFSIALYNTYESGDSRLALMKKVIRGANLSTPEKGIWLYKFNGYNGVYGLDNIPIIRLSEMYHIRAEAYLKKPVKEELNALNDINFMRVARKLTPVNNISGQELLTLAENERRKEFIGEGHRFFDLKRWGRDISKSPEGIAAGYVALSWDDPRVVARIPLTDAQPNGANPNLVQNPGY